MLLSPIISLIRTASLEIDKLSIIFTRILLYLLKLSGRFMVPDEFEVTSVYLAGPLPKVTKEDPLRILVRSKSSYKVIQPLFESPPPLMLAIRSGQSANILPDGTSTPLSAIACRILDFTPCNLVISLAIDIITPIIQITAVLRCLACCQHIPLLRMNLH